MILSAQVQAGWFMTAVLTGFALALGYDILRTVHLLVRQKKRLTALEDGIYWLAAVGVVVWLLQQMTAGEVRGYLLVGVLLGMGLYAMLISPTFFAIACRLTQAIRQVVRFFWTAICMPFRLLWLLVKSLGKFWLGLFSNLWPKPLHFSSVCAKIKKKRRTAEEKR